MQYSLILTGKIKPYVRMTRRGKWVRPEALEYQASQAALQYQIRDQLRDWDLPMLPAQTPLFARLEISTTNGLHKCDADNLTKAVLDAGNKLVYPDDCWLDRIAVERRLGDADICIFTVGTI